MNSKIKIIAKNRSAYYNYEIKEKLEAGIVLSGTEVKSLRQGQLNLSDAYALIRSGEIWITNFYIKPYEEGNRFNKDPLRDRKLLLHKSEIMKLIGQIQQKGATLIPTKIYFKAGKIKLEIGIAFGKKNYDKRQDEAKKQANREIEKNLKLKY